MACSFLGPLALPIHAEEEPAPVAAFSVEKISAAIKPSLVTVLSLGRDGATQGMGTGFVISTDGLVATNLHVVGEARRITVELQDGSRPPVEEILAWSREDDLIIFRLAGQKLTPLPLASPAEASPQGAKVVAMGNPMGLRYSVVEGILSERRKVDGRELLQLAMPIERGNSGGPLVDESGRVQGIINMKSAVTENLGYAVPVGRLQRLLDHPSPVKMENWLTIGALNPRLWEADDQGARWFQRAGRISVEGSGGGFGGRSLCFWKKPPPEFPYEMSVEVRLDDEAGAAGLAFCCEEQDVHYAFYPTNGKMRLTRFQGQDVTSWTILDEFTCPHYHPREWNTLHIKVTEEEIFCSVNGHLVLSRKENLLRKGPAGLVKFRQTVPLFRRFQLGKDLANLAPNATEDLALLKEVKALEPLPNHMLEPNHLLLTAPQTSTKLLLAEAKAAELRAGELRKLARQVHVQGAIAELVKEVSGKKESEINLAKACLLIARLDNEEVDSSAYLEELANLAEAAEQAIPKDMPGHQRAADLIRWLFQESGFHGSLDDFKAKSNSYLNEVIDDREGLPITLSVLVLDIAERLKIPMVGLGLPGHFVVASRPEDGAAEAEIYDVFHGGKKLTRAEAEALCQAPEIDPEWFEPVTKTAILIRILRNLSSTQLEEDSREALPYLDAILSLSPDESNERFRRALVRFQLNLRPEAKADVQWLLEHRPEGIHLPRLELLLAELEKE